MKSAPTQCVVCSVDGEPLVWNGMEVLRCPRCRLAWRSSFDISADYYALLHEGETGIGGGKAATRLRNAEDRLASTKKFLPTSGICDIGCGDGSFLSVLREKGYRECWGIEPSAYACELASGKKLEVVQGTIADLPQAAQGRALDTITLFHVIEHVPDPLEVLQIFRDALPPGGILIIETPDADAALQRVTEHTNALVYREHLFYWTEPSLRRVLAQKGFEVLAVGHRSFDWRHSSLSSSLMRLGLGRGRAASGFPADPGGIRRDAPSRQRMASGEPPSPKGGVIRAMVRALLARIVHLLKRDDYLLVIVQRL